MVFLDNLYSRNLLLGLACNEFTKEMSLDISNNGLGSHGAHVLESCVHGVRCISSLDISDNSTGYTAFKRFIMLTQCNFRHGFRSV